MNLILVSDEDYTADDTVVLKGRRFEHILRVHRAAVGESLRVGRINGNMGQGLISRCSATEIELRLRLEESPPPPVDVTLLLALPRPKFLTKVLQTATSFGVKRIFLFNSYRVEKVYWHCEQLSPEAIREACLLGLEQARDTVLPEIQQRRLFKPFIEDEVPTLIQGTQAILAHPVSAVDCPYGHQNPVTLAIGPEGGFIDYEVKKFEEAGFDKVRLYPRILKVEAAVSALLGRLI